MSIPDFSVKYLIQDKFKHYFDNVSIRFYRKSRLVSFRNNLQASIAKSRKRSLSYPGDVQIR